MSVVLNGANALYNSSIVVNGGTIYPMTIAGWFKVADYPSTTAAVASLDNNDQRLNCAFLRPDGNGAGTYPVATATYAGTWTFAHSTTDHSTGTWHHIMCVWYSTTRRVVYLDGNYYGEDTTSQNALATYTFAIGCRRPTGSTASYLTGKIAEIGLWAEALEQNDAAKLANGVRPNEVGSVQEYWPLYDSKATGISGGSALTDKGTGITYDDADHPTMGYWVDLIDEYDDSETTSISIDASSDYAAQTFTATENYNIAGVALKLWKGSGDNVGRVVVELQGVDGGGDPDGTIYASGVIDDTEIADSEGSRPWVPCFFHAPYSLTSSSQYAIVIHGDSIDASNILYMSAESSGGYSGGAQNYSTDSGSTWSGPYSSDIGFQTFEYSLAIFVYLSGLDFSGEGGIDIDATHQKFVQYGLDFFGEGGIDLEQPGTTNANHLGYIMSIPATTIQPGHDSGTNKTGISLWNVPKPQIRTPILMSTSVERTEQVPMDQNKRTGAGIYRSVETWWYEHAHLIPRIVQDVGNVVSEQTIQGELYNADRKDSITISSVINNLGTGIDIDGVPAVPFVLDSQEGIPFTVTVKRTGDLSINASYTFVQSTGEEYTIYIVGSRIVLFPFRPEAPLREHLIFDTKIVEAVDGTEQRIARRPKPRGLFEVTYKNERKAIEMLLFDRQKKIVAIPAWHEPAFITAAASVDDSTVYVNTTDYANFYVGGYAVVFQDQYTFDALKIESMTDTSITFESGLSFDYTTKAEVMPLMTAYIEASSASMKKPYNEQFFNLRLHVDATDNDIADDSGWNTYAGQLFLDDPNLITGGQLSESLQTKVVVLDNISGFRTQVSSWGHNKRFSKKGFKTNTREELWKLRKLLHHLSGQQVSFYIPTFSKDIVPIEDMLIGTFVLTMDNIGYSVNAYQRWPKQVVRVVLKDGTKFIRTIQNSAEVSSSVEQLTLSAAWPATYTPDDIERIEFLEKVRLAVDDIVITHYNALGQSQCIVDMKEVNE